MPTTPETAVAAADAGGGALALSGEMTIYRAAELRQELAAGVDAGARTFDLSGVTEIDSSGLQLLAAIRASVARAGGFARFVQPSACVKEICTTCGLLPWLHQGAEGA